MAGIFGARMKGAWPIPAPADPTGKALISGIPIAPNVTTATTDPSQASPTLANAMPQWKKPSTLQTIAGVIGDSLSQWSGGQALFGQTQALRQKAMYDAAMQQRERANKFADWQQQYDYEGAHPKPANNDTENDYNYIASKLGPEAATQYLRNVAAGTPIVVRNPDGTIQPVSRSEFANGQTTPQAAPPGVTFTPIDGPVTPAAAAPMLRGAASSTVISPADAARIRASLGPNGQAAFGQWLQQHNVTVGSQ